MDRRTFLTWVGVGWVASSLPVAIAACSTPQTSTPESPTQDPATDTSGGRSREDGFAAVGTISTLEEEGHILNQQFLAGPVMIVRDPGASEKLLALDPTCTHQGCTVNWDPEMQQFVCPCHGSQFSPGGERSRGPATAPLKRYDVRVEGDTILVKAA